jgi:hypothetical protein
MCRKVPLNAQDSYGAPEIDFDRRNGVLWVEQWDNKGLCQSAARGSGRPISLGYVRTGVCMSMVTSNKTLHSRLIEPNEGHSSESY